VLYTVITPPAYEPITLSDAKQHIRANDETDEDRTIAHFIKTAREYCENFMSRAVAEQTLEACADNFPTKNFIRLPMPPVLSVESFTYKKCTGEEMALAENTDYLVDTVDGRLVLPYGASWPAFIPYSVNPIKVRYRAGYASAPGPIRQAMLLLVGYWNENREAVGEVSGPIAFSVKALLSQYRARWF
jgi:uncharacterized phiE125 gp8 family phage protein